MRTLVVLLVIFGIVLAMTGCDPAAALSATATPLPTPTSPPAPTDTPFPLSEIVMGTAERFNAGDLEGTMAYWTDNAIFYMFGMPPTGSEIAAGKEQIRAVFEENIASHSQWEIEVVRIVGDTIYTQSKNWHDFTRQIGAAPLEAEGIFLIEDDRIAEYTWTLTEDSAAQLKIALAEAMAGEADSEAEEETETSSPAETPVSELTVTISNGMCSYDGPLTLQAGEVLVTVDTEESNREAYAVTFLTLAPDKDFMDLMASTLGGPPAWAELLHYQEVGPGESRTYSIDVAEGPLYGICWSKPPDHPIGNIGPFVVSP